MATKNYVRIQSDITITVTGGLQHKDNTDKDAHIADKLKISPSWNKLKVDIKKGKGIYPSEIVEWSTVKALEKDGILTIGAFVDDPEDDGQKQVKEELVRNIKEVNQEKSLADIAK